MAVHWVMGASGLNDILFNTLQQDKNGPNIIKIKLCKFASMSGDSNAPSTTDGPPKQQGGTPLPFVDHDSKGYHNTEWFQWELNVQL
eukprot:3963938-Ditylum_brightwellii.AAC.1